MAKLQTLALYLAAGIDVESRFWGRGALLGLPYVQPWDRSPAGPHAHLYFEAAPPNEVCSGVKELSHVKPVLWAPEDVLTAVEAANGKLPEHWQTVILAIEDLDEMAAFVDAARALGIALNLPAGSYVRKEVRNA